jgi:hypothetical protein
MRARRIIEGATFGPQVVRAASAAFDAAWVEIADRFDTEMHGEVREHLASSIISAAREDSADADMLRRAGLSAMARGYPRHFAIPPDQSSTGASGTDD